MRPSMKRATKRAVGAGLFTGIAYALWRAWRARVPQTPREIEWASAPFPFPPVPRPATPTATASAAPTAPPTAVPARVPDAVAAPDAVDANADGSCPLGYPVKGKLTSGIYHVEGGANYERTHADRCYTDERAAQREGLRRSKV